MGGLWSDTDRTDRILRDKIRVSAGRKRPAWSLSATRLAPGYAAARTLHRSMDRSSSAKGHSPAGSKCFAGRKPPAWLGLAHCPAAAAAAPPALLPTAR